MQSHTEMPRINETGWAFHPDTLESAGIKVRFEPGHIRWAFDWRRFWFRRGYYLFETWDGLGIGYRWIWLDEAS